MSHLKSIVKNFSIRNFSHERKKESKSNIPNIKSTLPKNNVLPTPSSDNNSFHQNTNKKVVSHRRDITQSDDILCNRRKKNQNRFIIAASPSERSYSSLHSFSGSFVNDVSRSNSSKRNLQPIQERKVLKDSKSQYEKYRKDRDMIALEKSVPIYNRNIDSLFKDIDNGIKQKKPLEERRSKGYINNEYNSHRSDKDPTNIMRGEGKSSDNNRAIKSNLSFRKPFTDRVRISSSNDSIICDPQLEMFKSIEKFNSQKQKNPSERNYRLKHYFHRSRELKELALLSAEEGNWLKSYHLLLDVLQMEEKMINSHDNACGPLELSKTFYYLGVTLKSLNQIQLALVAFKEAFALRHDIVNENNDEQLENIIENMRILQNMTFSSSAVNDHHQQQRLTYCKNDSSQRIFRYEDNGSNTISSLPSREPLGKINSYSTSSLARSA